MVRRRYSREFDRSLEGETWKKRRDKLLLFGEYAYRSFLKLEDILEKKADIVLTNVLKWMVAKEGKKFKEDLRQMKRYAGMALRMTKSTENVLQSPIVVAVARNLEQERSENAKYSTMRNINK